MQPKLNTPTLPPELWAKIFTYLPPVDLIRGVLPVSKEFRRQAYQAMQNVDWFREWGIWYQISDEFMESIVPPNTLSIGHRPGQICGDYKIFSYHHHHPDDIDRLVMRFPSVSTLSLPRVARRSDPLRQVGVEMRSLKEYDGNAALYEMDDVVFNTLVHNQSLQRLTLFNPSFRRAQEDRSRGIFTSHHLRALQALPHLRYLGIHCEALDPESFHVLNHFPALTALELCGLKEATFSGLAQAISEELGQRLTLASLEGNIRESMLTFLGKCPHLQDLALFGDHALIPLSPLPELKSFRALYLGDQYEGPLFECFPSLENLVIPIEPLCQHSEVQLKEGLRNSKSLEIMDLETRTGTLSVGFVLQEISSICHLERLKVVDDPDSQVLIRSSWPNLKRLDFHIAFGNPSINLRQLREICDRFPKLTHLSLRLRRYHDLECLLKLAALEELRLSMPSSLDIQRIFDTGNALFPLEADGKDRLTTFPRAQKFLLLFKFGHYLVVKTRLGELQRWICAVERDGTRCLGIPQSSFRRIFPSHILRQELPSGLKPF